MGTEKRIGKETAERGKSNGSTGPIARKSIPIARWRHVEEAVKATDSLEQRRGHAHVGHPNWPDRSSFAATRGAVWLAE
jgi:hypothetical protein